jgi:hypothetical protein
MSGMNKKVPPLRKGAGVAEIIEHLRSRCDEDGDCLIWTGAVNTRPSFILNGQKVSVRRYLYEHTRRPVSKKLFVCAGCGNMRCVNPHHVKLLDHKGIAEAGVKSGRLGSPDHVARMTQSARSRSRIDINVVRSIRAAETVREACDLSGLHESHVIKIRRNQIWREEVSGASVFSWRPNESAA